MKQNSLLTVIALVFIVGIAAGYSLNHLMGPQNASSNTEDSANGDVSKTAENNNQPPPMVTIGSTEMLETVLPALSPAWTSIHFKWMKENESRYQDLFELDSVQSILNDFTSSLPNGATETIQYLYNNADRLEIFLLPPESNQPQQRFAAAFPYTENIDDASDTKSNFHPLFAYWQSVYPEIEIKEAPNGKMNFLSVQTPLGEYTGLVSDGVAWFSNHTPGFPALFTAPIQNSKEKPPVNPRDEIVKRYPNSAVTLFLNGAQEGAAAMALPGFIPQMLTQFGIHEAVMAYQIQPNGIQMSIHAPSAAFPEWTKTWAPFSSFPFTSEDPMGLLEFAFQVPVMSASGTVETMTAPESGNEKQENVNPIQAMNMSQTLIGMLPPGSVAGFNVFGFYQGQPALAMRFNETDTAPKWFEMLNTMPQVTSNEVKITQIPAKHYQFQNSPFAGILGRNDLVVMERDAVTYVFDSPLAGKNYFGEINSDPIGKTRRDIKVREGLQFVEDQAQIKGVLTKDWFSQWLLLETHRYKKNPKLRYELKQLSDDLQPYITSIHFSAGIREQEWFLDSHAPAADGHLVDLFLLSSMLRSFLPGH